MENLCKNKTKTCKSNESPRKTYENQRKSMKNPWEIYANLPFYMASAFLVSSMIHAVFAEEVSCCGFKQLLHMELGPKYGRLFVTIVWNLFSPIGFHLHTWWFWALPLRPCGVLQTQNCMRQRGNNFSSRQTSEVYKVAYSVLRKTPW